MEKSMCEDAKFASIIDNVRRLPKPSYCCPSGKKVTQMCCNKYCDSSFFCSDDDCESCYEKHQGCGGKSYNISYFTNKLNKIAILRNEVLQSIREIDRKFKQSITIHYEQFCKKSPLYSLNQKEEGLIKKIYQNEKYQNISGSEAADLLSEINQITENYNTVVADKVKWYDQKMTQMSKETGKFKESLRKSMITFKEINFESSILSPLTGKQKRIFLLKSLTEEKPVKSLRLLYRASINGFKANRYYSKCSHKKNTVTIVLTQFNKTIAGYTHYSGLDLGEDQSYINDAEKKCFLLQLDLQQKYVPITENGLLSFYSDWGPSFGNDDGAQEDEQQQFQGHDLCISNDCNHNSQSYANFPRTYNLEGPKKYVNSQQSYTAFSGATEGCNFRVLEYEVFQVIFENE